MNKEEVFNKLKDIICECLPNLNKDDLQLDTKIDSIEDLTSLSLMMILFDTEEEFKISIEDPSKIKCLNDICLCILEEK